MDDHNSERLKEKIRKLELQAEAFEQVETLANEQRQLSIDLNSIDNVDDGVAKCLDSVLKVSGMDCGAIYLFDRGTGELDMVVHEGLSKSFIENASHYDADSDNVKLILDGVAVYTEYLQLGVTLTESEKKEALKAIAVIPFFNKSIVTGCINIASHEKDEVPVYARKALESIAAQIGSSIARLEVEEALQKSMADLEHKVDERTAELVRARVKDHKKLERKVAERTRELKKAKEKAEFADKAKSDFLANISHELRNPMHQVLAYSKNGLRKFDQVSNDKLRHYFRQIRTSADRLMLLLNQLLDLTKMEAGRMQYDFKTNSITHIINEVILEFEQTLSDQDIRIDIQENVSGKIVCDYLSMSQVIRNLLLNAVQFSPAHKVISVVLEKGEKNEKAQSVAGVTVTICDQGVGIPENELESVFDKFTQSSKTNTGAGGTGLGLAICQEIIKAHSGKIWAENNLDEGVSLKFLIPYK